MNSKSWADYPSLGLKELNQKDVDLLISSGLWAIECHSAHVDTKDAYFLCPLDERKYWCSTNEQFVVKNTNVVIYTWSSIEKEIERMKL